MHRYYEKYLIVLCFVAFACSDGDDANQEESTGGIGGSEEIAESDTGPSESTVDNLYQELKSSVQYESDPNVTSDDQSALATGNTAFALDMYQELRSQSPSNFFFSPYSISVAMAMTYAGARNNTEAEIAETMYFTLPQERLHPAFNAENIAINSRGEGILETAFKLNVVNSIWGQTGFDFLDSYLDTLAQNYDAGLRIVDFKNAPNACRVAINDWVEKQTEQRIEELIPLNGIDMYTRLVLVNAVYFNATWSAPFEKEATKDENFYLLDGQVVEVPMMKRTEHFRYASGHDFEAIELPYKGNAVSMVIIVPVENAFESFDAALSSGMLSRTIAGLTRNLVALEMPRWEVATDSISLKSIFAKLGMADAFREDADFTGICQKRELFISDVYHKAFIDVDEARTEAAAATAVVGMGGTGGSENAPPVPIPFTINRPFIYLIRDIPTQTILFMGRTIDPR